LGSGGLQNGHGHAQYASLGDELRALWRLQREQEPKSPFVFTSERGAPFTTAGFAQGVLIVAVVTAPSRPELSDPAGSPPIAHRREVTKSRCVAGAIRLIVARDVEPMKGRSAPLACSVPRAKYTRVSAAHRLPIPPTDWSESPRTTGEPKITPSMSVAGRASSAGWPGTRIGIGIAR
jgi:hypothetical protein